MNILLLDDNADYRSLLSLALSEGGHTVFSADDGVEGTEILESHDIDVIISDIRMPRMDGIKLNAYARSSSKYKNTKFVFVTGFKEVYAAAVVLDPKLDFFLDKTVPTGTILQLVNMLQPGEKAGKSTEVCEKTDSAASAMTATNPPAE